MNPWSKFKALFRRTTLDVEMGEEMRLHLELQTERNIAAGMSADEARYAAQRMFGGVEQIKEQCRDQRGWVWLELLAKEIGFAARSLRRAPGFSLAVLATLALCIGPNTAILSALYSLVYQPLPFYEPERLVSITNVAEKAGGARRPSSVAQSQDFTARADRFEGFGYFSSKGAVIGEGETASRGLGLEVSPELLPVLGVRPRLGRFFLAGENTPGKDRVVVLTSAAWEKRFGANPAVIGRGLRLDGEVFTVVGVAPAELTEVFTDLEFIRPYPVDEGATNAQARYAASVHLVGRLRSSVSRAAGQAQLEVLEKRFYDEIATPQTRGMLDAGGYRIAVNDARQDLADPIRAPLLLLQGGAAFVLLIGCVNVASLLLARASTKRPELAVRHALGAGWATLLRQLLAESALLVGCAGAAGLGLAWSLLRIMNRYLPGVVHHVPPLALNAPVLGLMLTVIAIISGVMGLVPLVLLWRTGLRIGDTPHASTGRGGRVVISGLVVGQLALALVLLVGAGLLIHSFARIMAVRPGFDAEHIVQGRVSLLKSKYPRPADRIAVQQRLLAAMKEIPGVEKASVSLDFGVTESFRTAPFIIRGEAAAPSAGRQSLVYYNAVSSDYFATLGIRRLEGRDFRDDDELQRSPVAIVDESFVARHFPGRSVVGREISLGTSPPAEGRPWIRIIGVAARANLAGQEQRDGWPFVYFPFKQQPVASFSLLVRSSRPAPEIVKEMRTRVQAIDPGLSLYATGTLAKALESMLGKRVALMVLLGIFATLALALASVGLYGVLNYDVAQRTREIGIRGAIGATRAQIVGMILREGLLKAGLGLGVGLLGAVLFTRLLRKMLFDVSATDPLAYGGVALLLLVIAGLASWLPARRAAKVDPIVALRYE